MKNTRSFLSRFCLATAPTVGLALVILAPARVQSQNVEDLKNQFNNVVGSRVEAMTILGGDYGVSGGTFSSFRGPNGTTQVSLDKFGGYGDIGDPEPIGNTGISWQPRLQGEMGYLEAKKVYTGGDLSGDVNKYQTFAIQFGGGGRFWYGDHFSIAPTLMGMYGHTKNIYTANNPNTQDIAATYDEQLVNWHANTWTIRPAAEAAWVQPYHRTIITLSSGYAYYHTESFSSSSSLININGDSGMWKNKIDVDIPLNKKLWGHELRTGGYFSRSELIDGLKSGLGTDHLYEFHPRLVLDFLGQLWKVQWIGIGGSYIWGGPLTGYSFGVDVAFRF